MTVKELIEELQNLPPDMEIYGYSEGVNLPLDSIDVYVEYLEKDHLDRSVKKEVLIINGPF